MSNPGSSFGALRLPVEPSCSPQTLQIKLLFLLKGGGGGGGGGGEYGKWREKTAKKWTVFNTV